MSSSRKFQIGAFIILLFHTVGLIGMNVGAYTSLFESVAWANILLSLGLLIWCHEFSFSQKRENAKATNTTPKSPEGDFNSHRPNEFKPSSGRLGVVLFIALTSILGFFAEMMGVKTGRIFGAYHYTDVFGWSLLSVPLIIGLNWTLLTYAIGISISRFQFPPIVKMLSGAVLMTVCDMLLEGFAIKHHFWVWESGLPPVQNFTGWFFVSLIMQSIYQLLIPASRNRLAAFYLIVLVTFLLLDRIL